MTKRLSLLPFATMMMACSAGAQTADAGRENEARAYFAMGCFWCGEADFEKVPGVYEVVSGYTGGNVENPTYEQVTYGNTGHYEAVRVSYDPSKLSYQDLLDVFWKNVDPFDARGQFCDKGSSYLSAIFPITKAQRDAARASLDAVEARFGREVETKIVVAETFYTAEGYHQDYYKKNPVKYDFYRQGCRRDARLAELWGD